MSNKMIFADEQIKSSEQMPEPWKIFIVDDDKDIHKITKFALKNLSFKDRPLSFTSAYSASEAIEVLQEGHQFAIVLLDIRMETNDSGLDVASFIRQRLHDNITRIIIRTGQPGDVPEKELIDTYDINDYKSKTELTVEKLFISIRTAIAQYDQISELENLNTDLEGRIKAALAKQQEQHEALVLQNRSAQMGELLNMLAHQWRQPLSLISAVSSQLKLSLALGEIDPIEMDEQVNKIETFTKELSNTINEFKTIYEPSKLSQDRPIYEIIERSSSLIHDLSIRQDIKINLICDKEEKTVYSSERLYQVILSILKNSQEVFLQRDIKKPQIDITVTKEPLFLIISIKDNAGGIDKANLDLIFDPYFSTKENKNGCGLGLYISKNIVEQYFKGKLSVVNSANGVCSTISLPNK